MDPKYKVNPPEASSVGGTPPIREVVSADEVRRMVGEQLTQLSGIYGVTPPKVKVFFEQREFLEASFDFNSIWRGEGFRLRRKVWRALRRSQKTVAGPHAPRIREGAGNGG